MNVPGRVLIATLSMAIAAPVAAQAPPAALDEFSMRLLSAHNHERAQFGIAPLLWDPELAASAASYGPALAAAGRLVHSPRASRPGQRENLWMGTRGAFSPEQMVANWSDEKQFFVPGVFPTVSTTGNWLDVAHYTTMIWPTTSRLGCALYRTLPYDYLICRYSPPGNIDGVPLP
jgi:hypothetical protein